MRDDFAQMIGLNEHQELRRQSSIASESEMRQQMECEQEIEEDKGVQMEESSEGKIEGSVSLDYFLAGANRFALTILAILLILVQMLASGADYWVSVW